MGAGKIEYVALMMGGWWRRGGIGPLCKRCDRGGQWDDRWPILPRTEGFRFGEICHWCDLGIHTFELTPHSSVCVACQDVA